MTHDVAAHIHQSDPPSQARQQHHAHKARLARLNGPIPAQYFDREEWFDVKIRELTQKNLALEGQVEKLRAALDRLDSKIGAITFIAGARQAAVENNRPTVAYIKKIVGNYFEVSASDMESISRHGVSIYARHIAMYFCRLLTLRSLPEIGRQFGKRDHTTTLHAVRKIERLVREDWTVAFDVAMVEQML